MFTNDDSKAQVDSAVAEVKKAVDLDPESQKDEYSGHSSAPYNTSSKD